MVQTKLEFAIKPIADAPNTDGANGQNGTNGTNGTDGKDGTNGKDGQTIIQASKEQQSNSDTGTNQSTDTSPNPKLTSANTGLFTSSDSSFTSTETTQLVFCSIFFVGVVLLCALIVKLRKNKAKFKHKKQSKSLRPSPLSSSRIFGLIAILMMVVGFGGMMSKVFNSSAKSLNEDGISTLGTVKASLVESKEGYNLYCATDQITTKATNNGYYLLMSTKNDGVLTSQSSGIKNITSAEDWDGLDLGQWGYIIGDDDVYNPLPLSSNSIIDVENEATTQGTLPIKFCAKISNNISKADFSADIEYTLVEKEEKSESYTNELLRSAKDSDGDGVSNREENRYGLNPISSDSDLDNLTDYDELKVYSTDPLNKDTDGDGLFDYSEIALSEEYGTDPLNEKSNGIELDGDRTYEYTGVSSGVVYQVKGKGNIPMSSVVVTDPSYVHKNLEDYDDTDTKAYVLESDSQIAEAEIKVPYYETTDQNSSNNDFDDTGAIFAPDGVEGASDILISSLTYEVDKETTGKTTVEPVTGAINNSNNQENVIVNSDNTITIKITNNNLDSKKILQQAIFVRAKTSEDTGLTDDTGALELSGEDLAKIFEIFTGVVNRIISFISKLVTFFVCTYAPNTESCALWDTHNNFDPIQQGFTSSFTNEDEPSDKKSLGMVKLPAWLMKKDVIYWPNRAFRDTHYGHIIDLTSFKPENEGDDNAYYDKVNEITRSISNRKVKEAISGVHSYAYFYSQTLGSKKNSAIDMFEKDLKSEIDEYPILTYGGNIDDMAERNAVLLISIERLSKNGSSNVQYKIGVYNPNNPNTIEERNVQCSSTACVFADIQGQPEVYIIRTKKPDYFKQDLTPRNPVEWDINLTESNYNIIED